MEQVKIVAGLSKEGAGVVRIEWADFERSMSPDNAFELGTALIRESLVAQTGAKLAKESGAISLVAPKAKSAESEEDLLTRLDIEARKP